ncbi:5-oxoprolinase subunit PxpB [Lysobacter yananisis]|uniref:5-oxoprolinase subunit PxpB n=1 Tax=Lysobacter yananisis TaxID=1003114 RepID=A0ABY9P3P1_9GAMM|nr:5-oxoprolinase subunit PxpB [Lysobacter yananisis]WMT01638.1 5-oxoprolinase subunit PxpB [Lysobacter yananisis]
MNDPPANPAGADRRPREGAAAVEFEALADDAWLLRLGERIDDALNARVHALAARVRAPAPPWLRDLVPAYASLAVFFDPARTDAATVRDWLLQRCGESADGGDIAAEGTARVVEIPVAYGGEFGPDLDEAASQLGLTAPQLVERHSGGDYRVAMIGFAPGFPYLSGLDPALALPRLASPRTQVAAGSVAIGGAQTGIYPRPGPGGWRLLGRTPLRLFDARREAPSLLQPGDRVRLRAIGADEFHALSDPARATPA